LERVLKSQEAMSTSLFLYQKSAIRKIEIIATTPKSWKAFQDCMAVVQLLGMAEVLIMCGEIT